MGDSLHIQFTEGDTMVVRASGLLDRDLGRVLLRVVTTALAVRVPRTHVDLAGLRSFTADAEVALIGCRRLAQLLPDRVTVTGGG